MNLSQQQSHHCGIETATWAVAERRNIRQQSHHCGIETQVGGCCEHQRCAQQSHHCGIETVIKLGISEVRHAAIAPLWD